MLSSAVLPKSKGWPVTKRINRSVPKLFACFAKSVSAWGYLNTPWLNAPAYPSRWSAMSSVAYAILRLRPSSVWQAPLRLTWEISSKRPIESSRAAPEFNSLHEQQRISQLLLQNSSLLLRLSTDENTITSRFGNEEGGDLDSRLHRRPSTGRKP